MNLKQLFEIDLNEKLKTKPELKSAFDGIVQIEIDGSCWHIDPSLSEQCIAAGEHPEADCRIFISAPDFQKLLNRKLNIPLALAFRKIRVSGNPSHLIKLKELLT